MGLPHFLLGQMVLDRLLEFPTAEIRLPTRLLEDCPVLLNLGVSIGDMGLIESRLRRQCGRQSRGL